MENQWVAGVGATSGTLSESRRQGVWWSVDGSYARKKIQGTRITLSYLPPFPWSHRAAFSPRYGFFLWQIRSIAHRFLLEFTHILLCAEP